MSISHLILMLDHSMFFPCFTLLLDGTMFMQSEVFWTLLVTFRGGMVASFTRVKATVNMFTCKNIFRQVMVACHTNKSWLIDRLKSLFSQGSGWVMFRQRVSNYILLTYIHYTWLTRSLQTFLPYIIQWQHTFLMLHIHPWMPFLPHSW